MPPPKTKLRFSDFVHDLRHAHPMFWVAAIVAAVIFLALSFVP